MTQIKEALSASQILVTLERTRQKPTSAPPSQNEARMRCWASKWLNLKQGNNPKVPQLELTVATFCAGIWQDSAHGRLLVLAGPNASAKTLCAEGVARWIRHVGHGKQWMPRAGEVKLIDCVFWPWAELLDNFKNGGWDVMRDLFDVTVLILDDLGAGHDPTGVGTDKLCQMLSRRQRRWTLVTTNLSPDSWEDKFDKRIASRLLRNSLIVDLSDVPDFNA